MANLNIKIVGTEGDTVLVKYNTDASLKPIDEYDAVAYQPKLLGTSTVDEFIAAIRPSLMIIAAQRDAAEKNTVGLDVTGWVGNSSTHTIIPTESTVTGPVIITTAVPPTGTQVPVAMITPEVVL
jgi:hypothetical protein